MVDQPTGAIKDNLYLSRYAFCDTLIAGPPPKHLDLVVTIPCFNEPDLIRSLASLRDCNLGNVTAEVIVVINEGENAPEPISQQNLLTYHEALEWAKRNSTHALTFHILYQNKLPAKHAGVGLARKIAMDEAVRRFQQIGKPEGVIICFDADSMCESNYLQATHQFFVSNPSSPGCSIHFEHPLSGNEEPEIYQAIIDYELFLRYYVNALRYAGFPYAYETIGSSMAVRSSAYQKQGGMNRRKAGEDFYFLHRIIPLGGFGEINNTTVIPSPRRSDRVPFGTGKAVNDWLQSRTLLTYSMQTFKDLKAFITAIDSLYYLKDDAFNEFLSQQPESVREFLIEIDFKTQLERIKGNAASASAFIKQFYQWFDGFRVLKYVHYARDNYFPNVPVKDAATELLNMLENTASDNSKVLLEQYRNFDRGSF